MKRLAILFVALLTLVGCGDEVEFNSPTLQGTKDYELWRAEYFNAAIDANGFLTITGGNNVETLELTIPSVAVGRYTLGDVESMEARFTDANGTVYSTSLRPDDALYPDYGFINLDEIINNTFTGTFGFNAWNAEGDIVNFGGITEQQGPDDPNNTGVDPINGGIFYRVPLTSGSIPAMVFTCADAEEATDLAQAAFDATTATGQTYINSDDYIAACNTLALALEAERTYCGDIEGVLQDRIDNLNDCTFPCQLATSNRNTAQNEFENATIANFVAACDNYRFYLEQQIEFCGDPNGNLQTIIDELDCTDDDSDGIPNAFEDFDGDGDLEDDDLDNDGIPNYLDEDDDGDGVLTIDEAKDEDGNPIDTDGDLNVDYLDNDDDGDGLLTQFELADGDTDSNGIDNYLDEDDDGDGTLTIDEGADPNGDGDPADAIDSDMDGLPDYLDDM